MNEELAKLLAMEGCDVLINQPDQFDHLLRGDDRIAALPSGADLTFVTKNAATASGRAMVLISWTAECNGKLYRAQYSTTVRLMKMVLRILDGAYDDDGMPRK